MPGGAVIIGDGIGSHAPKNRFAGILMISRCFVFTVILFSASCSAFAAFGGILFGYDTGVISGIKVMKDWLRTFGAPSSDLGKNPTGYAITSSQESLVVSILSVGTFFGALAGAPAADLLGRKWGIVFANAVFCAGVALQTASTALPLFIVGRVLAGAGVGLVSVLVPMYQSECSPKWIRGAIVSCYQWAITIGLLIAAVVNDATKDRDDHSSYRIPIAVQFVWSAVLVGGMLFLPESPRWLVKRDNDDAAARALARLTSSPADSEEVQLELRDIRAALEEERARGESGYLDCFRPSKNKILLRTLSGIFLQAWQQLTGINFIFYYGTTFFQNAGISNSFLITVATNIVNVFMTLPGMWGVERFGRRRLLIVGAIGMCVCEFIVAIVGVTVSVENTAGQQCLIAFVCIYIAFFASTWGPIAWVLTGEIFPLNVRAKAMSLATASNWLWNFGIGYATPYLVNDEPGSAGLESRVFFIWGSTCFCCLIFTYFCIPETKGLSLEQIDILYTNSTPISSVAYRKQLIAGDVRAADVLGTGKGGDDGEKAYYDGKDAVEKV